MQSMLVVSKSEPDALMLGILAFSATVCDPRMRRHRLCSSAYRMIKFSL